MTIDIDQPWVQPLLDLVQGEEQDLGALLFLLWAREKGYIKPGYDIAAIFKEYVEVDDDDGTVVVAHPG